MWALDTDREGLLSILQSEEGGGGARPVGEMPRASVEKGRIRLLWGKVEALYDLPVGIEIAQRDIDEFFAWTNTYLPSWSPITAFFRVVSESRELEAVWQDVHSNSNAYKSATVGLAIGEALVHSGGRYDIERLPYSGCMATFSFVAARGMKRGIPVRALAERWDMCRRATGQDPLAVRTEELLGPWEFIEDITLGFGERRATPSRNSTREAVERALRNIVESGEVDGAVWRTVTRGFPEIRRTLDHMRDTQEARLIAFERMLKEIGSGRKKQSLEASFLVGYVASLIAPGSLKHAHILLGQLERLPTAVIWLAMFASIYRKSQLRLTRMAHLVWKAISDEEDLLSRPTCDIGLAELCILRDAGFMGDNLQGSTRGRLIVELAPGVNTTVRWPRHDEIVDSPGQGELFVRNATELASIANELEESRWHLQKLAKRLQELGGTRK